jgi:hypothetical protein
MHGMSWRVLRAALCVPSIVEQYEAEAGPWQRAQALRDSTGS